MSTKYVYICDHCGAECSDKFEFSLFGKWRRKEARYIPDNVHGCTREHTILAVAAILGIGVDGKATGLLVGKQKEIDRLRDVVMEHSSNVDKQAAKLREYEASIVEHHRQIEELRGQLESRPDAAEVLQRVRDKLAHEDDPSGHFRGILDAEIASLTGPKKPTKPAVDHVHELGSCTHCDASKPQACMDCGGTGLLLSGQQCSDCRGKGYL